MDTNLCENCGHSKAKHRRIYTERRGARPFDMVCAFIYENGVRCGCRDFKEMEIIKRQIKGGNYGNKQQLISTVMRVIKNPEERQAWLDLMAEGYAGELQKQSFNTKKYYKAHREASNRNDEHKRIQRNKALWRKKVIDNPSIAFDVLEKAISEN